MSYFYSFLQKAVDFCNGLRYTEAMKNTYDRSLCCTELGGIQIKVFRTGKSVRLRDKAQMPPHNVAATSVHSHFTYEIFFVTAGMLELVTEESTTVYERAAVIIPPRWKHYTIPKGGDCYCLLFTAERPLSFLPSGICALPLSDDAILYVRKMAQKTEDECEKSQHEAELLTALLFSELMGDLIVSGEHTHKSKGATKHINKIEQYVNGHVYERITLENVAKAMFLSPRQVSRIVTAECGCTLSQLVNAKKLDAAQMLLCNTDMSIAEIAAKVSPCAENYFYQLFKKRFGLTPLQYRKERKS